MGGPEKIPQDPGDEHLQSPPIEHAHIGHQSDDSDDLNPHNGYQPLAMDDEPGGVQGGGDDDDIDLTTAEVTHGDPNMPFIECADVEIERQVWNEPRPQELQIELDNARTEQILKAMSKITLPNMTVPEWAVGVPEERWKHELLERIQNRKSSANTGNKREDS